MPEVEREKPGQDAASEPLRAAERPSGGFRSAWVGFCLVCGVSTALGGVGYVIVVWIVAAMMACGLARIGWPPVRGVFR